MPLPPHVLQRAAQGNEQALIALVCARKERVYRFAVTLLANQLEPQVCSQAPATLETLAQLCAPSGALRYGFSASVSSWPAPAQARRRARRRARASLPPAAPVRPETLLRHWQLVVALCRAITLLPGEYREVLVLADVEGLRDEQVAWLLELDEAKTRERLQRARMLVREALLAGQAA